MDSLTTNVNNKALTVDTIEEGDSSDSLLRQTKFPAIHLENTQTDVDWKRFTAKRLKNEKETDLEEKAVHNEEETDLEKDNGIVRQIKRYKTRS